MSRRLVVLMLLSVVLLPAVSSADELAAPTYPELKVEGGYDGAQTHGVRVEDAAGASPRVVIGGTLDVEGMPEKARDVNRFITWNFRLTGCKGRTVRFELYYARAGSWPLRTLAPAVVYADGRLETMRGITVTSYGPAEGRHLEKVGVRWTHRFRDDPARVSYSIPFTNDDVAQLVDELRGNKAVTVHELGRTPRFDLPLYQIVVTDPSVPDKDKRGVWLYGGEDPWEFPGIAALAGFARFVAGDDPLAAEFRKRFVLSAIPLVNPDAVHRGDTNFYMDARGRDIINTGLSWKRTDIAAHEMIKAAMRKWKDDGRSVDLMTTMHSSCFWSAVMRIDWAYDAPTAQRFIDEVYAKKYIPWAAGKGMGTPADMSGTLGASLAATLWPDRLLFFGQHLEQIVMPKWELLGLPKARWPDDLPTDFLRCQREDLAAQGMLFARAVADFYGLTVPPEKVPPLLMCGDVDAYAGKLGEPRTYTVLYRDLEGRDAAFVRLRISGTTVAMTRAAGQTPVKGVLYEAAVPLAEGDNSYFFEASSGATTIRYPATGTLLGPVAVP